MPHKSIEIWVDAQLSPALSNFLQKTINVSAKSLKELGLRDADDITIFNIAREKDAIILTKDGDFVDLIIRLKSPPKVILLSCGNTSNKVVMDILRRKLPQALELLQHPDNSIVEISD